MRRQHVVFCKMEEPSKKAKACCVFQMISAVPKVKSSRGLPFKTPSYCSAVEADIKRWLAAGLTTHLSNKQ